MRPPSPRGTALTAGRVAGWLSRFRFYRASPDENALRDWIERFKPTHRDLAARILDSVEIKSEEEIQLGYRDALASLPGWHTNGSRRKGTWVFVGFGKTAGESGQSMLRLFREASHMTARGTIISFVARRTYRQ